jgi:hypothetical protein
MSEDNKKDSDNKNSSDVMIILLIATIIYGILTQLFIICPIKYNKWKKVDKDVRANFWTMMSPCGDGFISFIGFISYFAHGLPCMFITLFILNINDIPRWGADFTAFMIILTILSLIFSIYMAILDINSTEYRIGNSGSSLRKLSLREIAEIEAKAAEDRRIAQEKHNIWSTEIDKELKDYTIEVPKF